MKGAKPNLKNVVPMKGDEVQTAPDAPDHLSEHGEMVWNRLAQLMVSKKRLEPHFHDLFAAYCESCADYIRFTIEIADYGSFYESLGRNGKQEKHRAAWKQRQESLASMQRLSALFGMSPVDEARIATGGQGDFLAALQAAMRGDD